MNKGKKENTAINHIDKTLDDYIKKVKGSNPIKAGRGGRMPEAKTRGGKDVKTRGRGGNRGGRLVQGVSRVSRGIRKTERGGSMIRRGGRGGRGGREMEVRVRGGRGGQIRRGGLIRTNVRRGGLIKTGARQRPQPRVIRVSAKREVENLRRTIGVLKRTGLKKADNVGKASGIFNKQKKVNNASNDNASKEAANSEGKRLFVSDLPMNVNNTDLLTLFGQFGPLSKCRIDYDNLGKSYGTAILEYKKKEYAQQALSEYNGAELDGKPIKIELSKAKDGANPDSPTLPAKKGKVIERGEIQGVRKRKTFRREQRGGFNDRGVSNSRGRNIGDRREYRDKIIRFRGRNDRYLDDRYVDDRYVREERVVYRDEFRPRGRGGNFRGERGGSFRGRRGERPFISRRR